MWYSNMLPASRYLAESECDAGYWFASLTPGKCSDVHSQLNAAAAAAAN